MKGSTVVLDVWNFPKWYEVVSIRLSCVLLNYHVNDTSYKNHTLRGSLSVLNMLFFAISIQTKPEMLSDILASVTNYEVCVNHKKNGIMLCICMHVCDEGVLLILKMIVEFDRAVHAYAGLYDG